MIHIVYERIRRLRWIAFVEAPAGLGYATVTVDGTTVPASLVATGLTRRHAERRLIRHLDRQAGIR